MTKNKLLKKSSLPQLFFHYFVIISVAYMALSVSPQAFAKKEEKKQLERLTRTELQSQLMSFGDRFGTIMTDGYLKFEASNPTQEARIQVRGEVMYSIISVVTIAAGPKPDVALIDLIVLTKLGRIVYEEHWRNVFGNQVDEIVIAFKLLEKDILKIASTVFTEMELAKIDSMILKWRRDNPTRHAFSYLRFDDFSGSRYHSDLVNQMKSGGLLAPVKDATKQIEESRLLAERAMYLATRLSILSGRFIDTWLSEWLVNPEVKRIITDFHSISQSSMQLGELTQKLPELIKKERTSAINQLMDRVSDERKATLEFIASDQKQLKGLLSDLRQTITESNQLISGTNLLAARLGLEPNTPSEFDLNDYRETITEVTVTIKRLQELLGTTEKLIETSAWEKMLPHFVDTLDKAEKEGEELVDHTFRQAIILILIWIVVYIIGRLILKLLKVKFFESKNTA